MGIYYETTYASNIEFSIITDNVLIDFQFDSCWFTMFVNHLFVEPMCHVDKTIARPDLAYWTDARNAATRRIFHQWPLRNLTSPGRK